MDINDLQEKVNKAQERVDKIKNTIEKHKKSYEKKVIALDKLLDEHNKPQRWNDIKDNSNVAHMFYETDPDFHHDFYWAVCDVQDKSRAIVDSGKKLKEAEQVLTNWQEKLRLEQVKIQYIQDNVPEVIKNFLNEWKAKVIKYYTKKAEEYPEAYQEYKEEKSRVYFECLKETVERLVSENREEFIDRYCYHREERLNSILEVLNEGYKPNNNYEYINLIHFHYSDRNDPDEHPKYREVVERFNAKFGDGFFQAWLSRKFDNDWLEKEIEQEKNNKLIDLMTRVSKITGEIVDASYLYIADDGNLNGYIIGKEGKAEVETIGAGGYNDHIILDSGRHGQVFHFRTLVKPRK